jgi:glycosyltransferase involved in cell wall biosynthesis
VALLSPDQAMPYPIEVHHRIRTNERDDYGSAARAVSRCADVVAIQHEDGLWGGADGEYVLDFVRALQVPAVTTLHGIRPDPTPSQRAVLTELISESVATVVLSKAAVSLLRDAYGVDRRRVSIIPHGIPELPLVDSATVKPALEVSGRDVILNFGLLGPEKGHELVLAALPAVIAAHPRVLYVVVGATNPDVLRRDGEAYRAKLAAQVERLGISKHVRFVDRFVGRVELTRWLEGADVFVSPASNLDQVASATLSYAMGAGRAVVSTPSAFATELLADGRGILAAADPAEFGGAIIDLLGDDTRRAATGRRAYAFSRQMVWSSVGAEYLGLFEQVRTKRTASVRSETLAAVSA